jgi:hypothetical protein
MMATGHRADPASTASGDEGARRKNLFSKDERLHLLSIMIQYAPLLDDKSASVFDRREIWRAIERDFHQAGFTGKTSAQLKKYWQNYKYHGRRAQAVNRARGARARPRARACVVCLLACVPAYACLPPSSPPGVCPVFVYARVHACAYTRFLRRYACMKLASTGRPEIRLLKWRSSFYSSQSGLSCLSYRGPHRFRPAVFRFPRYPAVHERTRININPHKIASQCTRASSRLSSGSLSVAARCSDDSSRPPSVLVPFHGSRSGLAAVERHAPAGILECPPKVTRYSGVASPTRTLLAAEQRIRSNRPDEDDAHVIDRLVYDCIAGREKASDFNPEGGDARGAAASGSARDRR